MDKFSEGFISIFLKYFGVLLNNEASCLYFY